MYISNIYYPILCHHRLSGLAGARAVAIAVSIFYILYCCVCAFGAIVSLFSMSIEHTIYIDCMRQILIRMIDTQIYVFVRLQHLLFLPFRSGFGFTLQRYNKFVYSRLV